MTKERIPIDRGAWAIGGTTMIGLGVGFIFLTTNIFIASLLTGIGLGLVIAALLPGRKA